MNTTRLLPPLDPITPLRIVLRAALLTLIAAGAAAQQQFDELRGGGIPSMGDGFTVDLVAGDVDGDGDLDLVLANGFQTRLCLNNGSAGGFTEVTATHMPPATAPLVPSALALGDVDGDGDLDLVVASSRYYFSPTQNRLYLNDGTGHFTDVTAARLPVVADQSYAVALADFDGDGDLDLVFGNTGGYFSSGQDRLYENNGAGTFTDVTAARMPARTRDTWSIVTGDVDRDGDLDLVTADTIYGDLLYLNDGTGTFTDSTAGHLPAGAAHGLLRLADFDGDGDLDLAAFTASSQNLYDNDGTGTFTDVSAARLPAAPDSRDVTVGDADGDGDLDLAIAAEPTRLFVNDGTGTFTDATATNMPAGHDFTLLFVDVDGDGDRDLVTGNSYQEPNRLLVNDGAGVFADVTTVRMPYHGEGAPVLGDVDGDGDLDAVFGGDSNHGPQQARLFRNDGRGGFVEDSAAMPPVTLERIALGDVDGDGDLDLVGTNPWNGANVLFLNGGTGAFTDVTASRMPVDVDASTSLALGDIDGDGDLDLVFGKVQPGIYGPLPAPDRLYVNDGRGTFTDVSSRQLPASADMTTAVVFGDADADGDLDLVIGVDGQNRLCLNNGAGVFTEVTATHLPVLADHTEDLALVDVDGDGDLDLVIGEGLWCPMPSPVCFVSPALLYENDGTGMFADVSATRFPAIARPARRIAPADVDDDGDVDLVLVGDWGNLLFVNDGTGTFSDASARLLPHADDDVAIGDVDGDGDPDLLLGSHLQLNLRRQLDAPLWMQVGRTYSLDCYMRYAPPSLLDIVQPYAAFAPASIPVPGIGTIGIDPTTSVQLTTLIVPQPAGLSQLQIVVPNHAALVGLHVWYQALTMSLPSDYRAGNVLSETVR